MAFQAAGRQGSTTPAVAVLGGDATWPTASLLRLAGIRVLDGEPPPKQIEPAMSERYGFSAASVRAGTLGDTRLLLQHLRCALDDVTPGNLVWTDRGGLFLDAARALVEPGAASASEVVANHSAHLAALRTVIANADLLVLPLRVVSVVEDGEGSFFPAPLVGMKPPKGCKTKVPSTSTEALQRAFGTFFQLLQEVRPGCVVRLLCPDQREEVCALARALAKEGNGVLYHPLVDELLLRLLIGEKDERLGILLSKVLHAVDVVGALVDATDNMPSIASVPSIAPFKAEEQRDRKLDKDEKKARKIERARRKSQENYGAQTVCEDELLDAFS